jgi:antitoxin ParD1/3/4
MGTKNISLPRDMEAYIEAKVASGEYAHASEVVRDAIRLLMREEAEKLEWLRAAVAQGAAEADSGDLLPAGEAIVEVKRRGRAMLRASRDASLARLRT